MGSSQSSSTTLNDLISVINQNITNIMIQTQNKSSSLCQTNQSQPISIVNLEGCTLKSSLNASTTCDTTTMFSTSGDTNLASIINDAIQQAATASTTAVQDTLSLPLSQQSTNTNTNLSTYMQNLVTTNFNTTTQNSCLSEATVTQGQPLTIGNCINSTIDLSQYAQINNVASCIATTLNQLFTNDTTIANVLQNASGSTSTSQQGLGTLISNIVSSIMGFLETWWLLIVIGLIVVGYFIYKILLSPAGQKSLETGSQVASQAIAAKISGGSNLGGSNLGSNLGGGLGGSLGGSNLGSNLGGR